MKTRSFSFEVIFAFLSILIVTVMVIIGYSYYSTSNSMLRLSEDLINQVNRTIVEKTISYLQPASQMVKLSAELKSSQDGKPTENPEIEQMMFKMLKLYPQLTIFSLGDQDGNFRMLKRMPDETISTKHIQIENGGQTVTWHYRDAAGKVTKTEEVPYAGYDPRTRDWYMGATVKKDTFWSDAYVFFTDKTPGITASHPMRDAAGNVTAVFGLDIRLEEISHFLKKQRIGKNGKAFILNRHGEVVAYPDLSKQVTEKDGKFQPTKAKDLDPVVAKSYARFEEAPHDRFNFKANEENYIASYTYFPSHFGKKWIIAVVVPENDFIGGIKETNLLSLLFSMVTLSIAILFAIILSRKISRPIIQLTKEAEKIKDFDLEGEVQIKSPIKEIQQMATAIQTMKSGLSSFQRYVPAKLVRELIKTGEEAHLGGQEKKLSILFSDIESFTSISEKIPPQELMIQLSEYLDALTHIIIERQGTIDKYIGDSIMAFWGAPLEDAQHVSNSCEAAIAMKKKVNALNEKWSKEGKMPLRTRIGIHTGSTIVGNIGSSERLNYTVLGDSVNLASRLEGINKNYGTVIIVSEAVKEACGDGFVFRPVDEVSVKGKTERTTIFELVDSRAESTGAVVENAETMQKAYGHIKANEWKMAIEILVEIKNDQDPLLQYYLALCAESGHPST